MEYASIIDSPLGWFATATVLANIPWPHMHVCAIDTLVRNTSLSKRCSFKYDSSAALSINFPAV